MAILHLMTGLFWHWDRDAPEPRTYPWYNGGEKGFAIVARDGDRCRVVVIGESARSEHNFIESWDPKDLPFNAPTIEQREEAAVEVHRDQYSPRDLRKVASDAFLLIQRFMEPE